MCSCNNKKSGGTGQKWLVILPSGQKKPYTSETEARMEASQTPGSRVRPA